MSAPSESKVLVTAVVIAGIIALAGYLSERGFRITRAPVNSDTPAESRGMGRTARLADGSASQSGKKSKLHAGHTPIPLLVNGKVSASLAGDTLETTLTPVTIVSKHDIRSGWALDEILAANGVTQARQVVFTDDKGKSWSAGWAQVVDRQHRLILAYSRSGVPLLFSGPVVEGDTPSPEQTRELISTLPGLIAFPHLAKIDVKK